MSDIGIQQLLPQYERGMLVDADFTYWEVLYDDGTVLCEAQGAKYPQIDRSRFKSFGLVHNGEKIFEMFCPPGLTGHNLVYRRRTELGQSGAGRGVVFLVGFSPHGPLYCVDVEQKRFWEDSVGLLPTLTPMPGEPADIHQSNDNQR